MNQIRAGHLSCVVAMTIVGASLAASAALVDYPIYGSQALRYAVAAALLFGVVLVRTVPMIRPTAGQWWRLLALAATGLAFFNICVIEGNARISPSLVGSVIGAAPVILALAGGAARRGDRRILLAAVVVVIGVVLVQGLGSVNLPGLLFALGALAGEVCFSLLAVPLLPRLGPLLVSTYVCALAVPMLLLVGLFAPGPLFAMPTVAEAVTLVYLAVMVTAVAFLLWYRGLTTIGPARAGLYCAVMPVAATAASVLLGFEPVRLHVLIGVLLVGLGLAVGTVRLPRRAQDLDGLRPAGSVRSAVEPAGGA